MPRESITLHIDPKLAFVVEDALLEHAAAFEAALNAENPLSFSLRQRWATHREYLTTLVAILREERDQG